MVDSDSKKTRIKACPPGEWPEVAGGTPVGWGQRPCGAGLRDGWEGPQSQESPRPSRETQPKGKKSAALKAGPYTCSPRATRGSERSHTQLY